MSEPSTSQNPSKQSRQPIPDLTPPACCPICNNPPQDPKYFLLCQWQIKRKEVSLLYIVYKVALATYYLVSLIHILANPQSFHLKYCFTSYFVTWLNYTAYILSTIQVIWSAGMLFKAYVTIGWLPESHDCYARFQICAVSLAGLTTIVYWTFFHFTLQMDLTINTIFFFIMNCILSFSDFLLASHKLYIIYFCYPICLVFWVCIGHLFVYIFGKVPITHRCIKEKSSATLLFDKWGSDASIGMHILLIFGISVVVNILIYLLYKMRLCVKKKLFTKFFPSVRSSGMSSKSRTSSV